MAKAATKLPMRVEEKKPERASAPEWQPFESLRRKINRLFDNCDEGFWRFPLGRSAFDIEPFSRRQPIWSTIPAMDVVEKEKAYEITAELPGMDESNVEVKVSSGTLIITGEKQEEKEEKKKDYYLSERRYGAFERRFEVPEGVDTDKIEANFKKGILTISLPQTAEAQKSAKKIEVKAG